MTIGEIISLENRQAVVLLSDGTRVSFITSHQSVVHGYIFRVGQTVSIRWSRDNSRVASVVPADATDLH